MDTRRRLAAIGDQLDESLGVRRQEARAVLCPVPQQRDIGRSPLRNVGRLDLDQVIPDPDQPRMEFAEEALERLARSIRDKGQLSPIRVRWSAAAGKWIIVAGERRWRATQRAGLTTIDCYFHEQALSESQILEEQLIENCLREDLQPLEEAKAFEKLMELNGWNAKQLAEAIRVHPSKVTRVLCAVWWTDAPPLNDAERAIQADFPRLLHLPNRPNCRQPIIVRDAIADRGATVRIRVSPARASPTSRGEERSTASIKSAAAAMASRSVTIPAPLHTYHTVPFDNLDGAIDELSEILSSCREY